MRPVIYKILNVENGKFYVGSTVNMYKRTYGHRHRLRKNNHHCKHLQAAWNFYGEKSFVFTVVEEVPCAGDLHDAENRWLQEHFGKEYCYNASKYADTPMLGSEHSDETRKKISQKVQAALARGAGGKYERSPETVKKLSESLIGNSCARGYRRTERECQAISERMKGNSLWLGKKHSEESKLKMGRPIIVTDPLGTERHYGTITIFRAESGLLIPTVQRALKSGEPLKKGPFKGYSFRYA